jgi:hypothetical protein
VALAGDTATDTQTVRYGHVVDFYTDDSELIASVAGHVTAVLRAGGVAVIVATSDHRAALEEALTAAEVDVDRLRAEGRYLSFDAATMLARLMVDGHPDPARFTTLIGGVIAAASAGGRPVHAFGEMVAILWAEAKVGAAIELESLWNDLGRQRDFHLQCAYPFASVAIIGDLAATRHMCHQHDVVLTPAAYDDGAPSSGATPWATEVSGFFIPVPRAAGAVRRFVAETMDAWGEYDLVDDVVSVVSELVNNALIHSESPFRVSLIRLDSTVRIAVHDADGRPPELQAPTTDGTDGRGLQMVAALANRWGSDPVPDGKIVWAEFDSSP